jgi:uncharacterized protein
LRIPIFPLNTVLFPGGVLTLKIFEQRYLDMTKACLRDDTPFGVCCIREGTEVGTPARHEMIGCTARIRDWEMPHLGLFHLVAQGTEVFRVLHAAPLASGLIEGEVEPLPESEGELQAELFALCRQLLQSLLDRVSEDTLPPPHALDSPRWVSYRLAELMRLPLEERQALLAERDDARRIERIARFVPRH